METEIFEGEKDSQHTEEISEIITAVPSWMVRWGTLLIFSILVLIVVLTSIIKYPDIVKTRVKINSLNSPKSILAKQNGKISQLLVKEKQMVRSGQRLAYFETVGNPEEILFVLSRLKEFRSHLIKKQTFNLNLPFNINFGELQSSYQDFHEQYLRFLSTQTNGYYLNKISYLKRDMARIQQLKRQINEQKVIQKKELQNQESEFKAYQQLFKNKVISKSEFLERENKYLAAKYPLQQSETSLLNNASNLSEKERELLDVEQTIEEERSRFFQKLEQCIADCETWVLKNVLISPINGNVSFSGFIQNNQNVMQNQEIFVVSPNNTSFFGEVDIPQYNMGKVRLGQLVLVKLKSYPSEQFGVIRGKLTGISDAALRDSVFIGKIAFTKIENKDRTNKIILKNGMLGDAEIVTKDNSLLQRFLQNVLKIFDNQ